MCTDSEYSHFFEIKTQKAEVVLSSSPFLHGEGHVNALFNTWMLSNALTSLRWKMY